jgi:NAD(P)-dependent dehydrogenase (short-subunit alcohol dehydrogenase family)
MKRTAIVTGGSRGIGLGIAKELAKDGFDLVIVGFRKESDVLKHFKDYAIEAIYIGADISKQEDREKIIKHTIQKFGRIDILVNNAGIAPIERVDLLDIEEESLDYVMNINLKGTFLLTQMVAKKMICEDNSNHFPRIINVSSVSSYTSSVNRGEYCISKAALSMVTTLFADRLANENVRVFEVRPGIIKTDMTAKVSEKYDSLINEGITPIKRWGYPEDVAGVVSLLCSPKMNFSTGDVINVDGGFHIRRL